MAQKEPAAMAAEQVNTMAETQREFFGAVTKMNQRWLERANAEAKLATDLGGKLAAARTVPDAVEAYQQWMTDRSRILADDSRQFVADCQTLMQEASRLIPKGWPVASS